MEQKPPVKDLVSKLRRSLGNIKYLPIKLKSSGLRDCDSFRERLPAGLRIRIIFMRIRGS
jgi:hypothetical protein